MVNRKNTDNVMHQSAERSDKITLKDYRDAVVKLYPPKLLELAGNLIKEEQRHQYGLAIIVAHTACEILVERIITKAFTDKKVTNLQKLIVSNSTSYNISAPRIKDLYIALTDDKTIGEESFWTPFTDSVKRRNDVVHRGIMFEQGDAQKSLDAVNEIVDYLDQKFSGS